MGVRSFESGSGVELFCEGCAKNLKSEVGENEKSLKKPYLDL